MLNESLSSGFDPINPTHLRAKTAHPLGKTLFNLRYNYSNDIPEFVARSDIDGKDKFKVRRGWFSGLVVALDVLVDEGRLSGRLRGYAQAFANRYQSRFDDDIWTNEIDIARGNRIIDRVLNALAENS